ncbi:MAG TPA: ATP-binding protein [Patescibacteria group bacterium]|nr:ATP-binding protein [Patescibacteria group bacterium]
MGTILTFLAILLGIAILASPIIFLQVRKVFREQKNFERGLKMVPLFIHLPPPSEDTEVGGRDLRDVIDENISKAQILYNIIAGTWQKGLKNRFYGQRHFTLEIVGTEGFVHFYAAVPVALVDLVKQAVVSAYPSARLEEVAEHNVFSPVGKISGTIGGEMTLKKHYAYPIATYQDLKRDSMQSLLNALSTLEKEDGVGIQFLLRPANPEWRKAASAVASQRRKGEKELKLGPGQALSGARQLFGALTKPPEGKGEKSGDKDLSSLDQAVFDSIDDKTRNPGYEVLIRIVVSSNIAQRAQAILNNVVASFALFDAQGKNGFKFTPAKDIERFVTAYILRFFPQENKQNILNSVELATLFHFPDQSNIPTSQLERQTSKQVDGPRNIPDEGLLLGYNLFRGIKKPIRVSLEDRRRHMYAVGQTGTGKSTFLENLAIQDMLHGEGFAFVDPHGDVAERLLSMVPRERTEDVVYFSPADMEYPMGLNLFEFNTPEQKDFLIQEAINMLYKLYDPQHQGIIGPRYEHWFRNAALTLMSDPEGSTFIDIPKVFTDNKYARQKLQYVKDQTVLDFWNKEMAQTSDYHKSEVLGWFVSKFGAFLSNEMMRNIIGQTKSAFDLREIMDNKKILIVNLSKGRTGELNSKLLGMIFVMKFQAAAMSRANIDEDKRVDFSLYVDEFQNFSTDSFATIMSEARKYHLNLIVANQFTTQLTEEIRDAVFGNMGTIVAFRVGQNDVEVLSRYFQPLFDGDDLLRVPNFNTIVRTLIGGVPTQPFSMSTMPALGNPNMQLAAALKQLSAAKYGRPRAKVESEIFERLATKEDNQKFGPSPFGAAAPGTPSPRPMSAPKPTGGSSFLDEWLSKRQAGLSSAPTPAQNPNPQPPSAPVSPFQNKPPIAADNKPKENIIQPATTVANKKPGAPQAGDSPAGELKISRPHKPGEDTIVIDKEGNLVNKDQQ